MLNVRQRPCQPWFRQQRAPPGAALWALWRQERRWDIASAPTRFDLLAFDRAADFDAAARISSGVQGVTTARGTSSGDSASGPGTRAPGQVSAPEQDGAVTLLRSVRLKDRAPADGYPWDLPAVRFLDRIV